MFEAIDLGMGGLFRLDDMVSRSISAENFHGAKGRGGAAETGTGARHAASIGRGWKISPSVVIPPGSTQVLADIEGPGVVRSMWFAGNVSRRDILRIYWDDQDHPSVECPLGEFFGYGWVRRGADPFSGPFFQLNSLPVVVNPNRGMNCFWPMPFRKRCRITVENRDDREYVCYYQVNYGLGRLTGDIACFHANFRQSAPLAAGSDHTIVDGISGRGQYVGTALFVGLNGGGNWWGEGEVKFFLDGDTDFPTICGTGTEDYFGGAYDWEVEGRYVPYSTPFMGMHQCIAPDGLYNHQQRFAMYRWHIPDPVRFDRDIRVTIQDLGWEQPGGRYMQRRDDFASTAYWYQVLPSARLAALPAPEALDVV